MTTRYEESLGEGLRYVETAFGDDEARRKLPMPGDWPTSNRRGIFCQLFADGVDEHVSHLVRVPFRQRFGRVAVPVEGLSYVATRSEHRGKGYVSALMKKSLERAAEQVDSMFLFGVYALYPKFGFTPCMIEADIVLSTHIGERARSIHGAVIRPMTSEDRPFVCELYNRAHAVRPCSVERVHPKYAGPRPTGDWGPHDQGVVLERDGQRLGYMVRTTDSFGQRHPVGVWELAAVDHLATEALIRDVVDLAISHRTEKVTFHDCPDSLTGVVLRRLDAQVRLTWTSDSGAEGCILNRDRLVTSLADEFERRAGRAEQEALTALAAGGLVADDRLLLPLITGFLSWDEALQTGRAQPSDRDDLMRAWFPGGHTPGLPLPYTHRLDRY